MVYKKANEGDADFSGYPSKRWIGFGIVGIIIVIVLLSTFYSVGPDEEGVIKRFGRYTRTVGPGLHFKIPFVETVMKVKVKYIFKEEFGFRTLKAGVKTIYAPGDFLYSSQIAKNLLASPRALFILFIAYPSAVLIIFSASPLALGIILL